MNSIRLVLSFATSFKWEVHQMDVKSAFLHGYLHEEIYMEQPLGFIKTYSSLVCRLKKSLYGLKQAPRVWYAKMDSFLLETGFSRCYSDNTIYTKKVVHKHLLYWLVSLIPIGPVTLMIKSLLQVVFTLSSRHITWACKKQSSISLSSEEAEYHGVVQSSKEALWLHQILLEFGFQQQHLTTLWCDNQSSIQLCKCPVKHQRIKHIELHMHFIRKLIHDHVLEVQYCSTDDQVVDISTDALTEVKFTKLRFMVGVQEVVTKGG
eukprot:PITA_19882